MLDFGTIMYCAALKAPVSNPGYQVLFRDTVDDKLKKKDSAGTVTAVVIA